MCWTGRESVTEKGKGGEKDWREGEMERGGRCDRREGERGGREGESERARELEGEGKREGEGANCCDGAPSPGVRSISPASP
jgi:hypothetical protein